MANPEAAGARSATSPAPGPRGREHRPSPTPPSAPASRTWLTACSGPLTPTCRSHSHQPVTEVPPSGPLFWTVTPRRSSGTSLRRGRPRRRVGTPRGRPPPGLAPSPRLAAEHDREPEEAADHHPADDLGHHQEGLGGDAEGQHGPEHGL